MNNINLKKLIKGLGLVFGYYFILPLLFLSPIISFFPNIDEYLARFIVTCLCGIVPIVYFRKDLVKNFKEFLKNKGLVFDKKYWKIYGIGLLCMMGANLVLNFISGGDIANNEAGIRDILNISMFTTLFSGIIIAPITEELVFKKSFDNTFVNMKSFVLFTGFLFAGMHIGTETSLIGLLYLIPYASLGIAFSYMYSKSDNIYTPVFYHMFHNTMTFVLLLLVL